ncbi:MAG: hypothetical protein KG003_07770 [Bacteroidetes bacterium]|nr:hypothetical protein [Bacteroidota bacterium]
MTESFNSLITVVQPAIDEIVLFATDGFNQIKLWWAENGAEISQAVEKVLRFILQIVQIQLGHIKQLWAEYGEQITAIVSATWNIVKTIITTAVQIIGNAIKLVAAIINGDWAKAWEAFKSILSVGINSGIAILKSFITITSNIFFGIVKIIYNIGRDIVVGLINGIKSKIAEANATAHDLVSGIITVMRAVPIIRSPSKVTTEIGENIGEGLAAGLENKTGRVRSAAKKIADETIKTLADAVKEFEKVSGLNPAQIARTNQADDYRQGANDLREIIKLRKELGVDQFEPLPDSPGAASAVLQGLQNKKQAADDYAKSLDELRESFEKLQESIIAEQKAFDDRKTGIIENGEINLIQLQKEIALLGVTDELEKIRIQNSFELQSLRVEMTNDGYGQQQVQEILDITEAEQNQLLELQQILRVRKEVLEASNLGNELNEKLLNVQNGGRELSEYEQTLRRLNEDFKNISPQQREQLLNTAAQIDAQKQFNEEYQQTYDFIRGAFDILTERGKSFGEKMKTIFAGILNSFKNMLLNMTSQFLTSKLFGGRQSGGGGFSLGNIFGGGGIGGTPPFNPNFAFAGGGGAGGFGGFASLLSQTPISPLSTSGTLESTIGLRGGGTYTSGLGNIGQTATSNLSSYSQFKQLFGGAGLVGGIAGALPLLGASLGSLVGGQSTGGQILGSLGGLAGGLAGSALLAPTAFAGIFGAAAPLLATVSLIAAPALLIGAYLLKRNAARRRDETTRDALMVDTLKQLNEIKAEMEAARPGINVKGLLDETGQISANYFTQANQLKDKKTRNIAIKDGNERVGIVPPNSAYPNALTNQIYALSDAAKLKEEIRAAAYERDRRILPEFASGGFIPKLATGDYFKPNGLVPGVFDRKDDILALISRGEMVLNPMQQQKIRAISGFDVFSYAGIPNYQQQQQPRMPKFAEGGNLSQSNSSVKTPDFQFNFNGNIVLEGFIAEPDAKAYLETPDGKQQVINIVDKGYDSRRLKLGRK